MALLQGQMEEEDSSYNEEGAEDEEEDQNETINSAAILYKPVFKSKTERLFHAENTTSNAVNNKVEESSTRIEAKELAAKIILNEISQSSSSFANSEQQQPQQDEGGSFFYDDEEDLKDPVQSDEWKLRELLRIKRDREERVQLRNEAVNVEEFRALPADEREAAYKEKLEKQLVEAENKTKYKYLQKYYHKGAFYGDESILAKRDYDAPTGEDKGTSKDVLPDVMQKKRFGLRGQTKWKHLSAEDTTDYLGTSYQKNALSLRNASKIGGTGGSLEGTFKRTKKQ